MFDCLGGKVGLNVDVSNSIRFDKFSFSTFYVSLPFYPTPF